MKQINLEEYNDYELIYLAKEKNELAYEILQKKYKPIILNLARKANKLYNNIGLEFSDYVVEGMAALDYAIYYFKEEYDNIFYTYATKLINYYIINKIRKCKQDKCLNNAIEWMDDLNYAYKEPNNIEISDQLKYIYKQLNPLEKEILKLKLRGFKYFDIANKLNITKKKVDNTLIKIRKIIKRRKE